MAKVLFIKREHLVENSVISGNVDSDKILPFIEIAQEIHIQSYLGSKLYDKLKADIVADTLTADYTTILDDYIQPMLIHFAMGSIYRTVHIRLAMAVHISTPVKIVCLWSSQKLTCLVTSTEI